jgi:hypothetical protein
VVTKPTCDNRVVHHWLVRLVFEVAVPAGAELWARPLVHHLEFLFSWADFDTSIDTIGRERASTVDVPLLEDAFLSSWVTTYKVVEGLDMRLCAVGSEG